MEITLIIAAVSAAIELVNKLLPTLTKNRERGEMTSDQEDNFDLDVVQKMQKPHWQVRIGSDPAHDTDNISGGGPA
jgi:hypothetical protein